VIFVISVEDTFRGFERNLRDLLEKLFINNYSILEEEDKTCPRQEDDPLRKGYILDISLKANFQAPFKIS